MFFQRSESPRNISGSSEIWDLCCMLNHFSAKLPKIDDWKARAQYMYRDWRPGKSQTCRRLCVRLGDSLHRAESPLHVWGKGHPVQKATPVPQERPNLGTNSLKFQVGQRAPKVHQTPRGRIFHFSVHFGLTCRHVPARFAKRADLCLLRRRGAQGGGG